MGRCGKRPSQVAMMTSAQIRQSFLDFFKSKQHTIVPSSSLMPDSPNLLFTNAGMNQFVPIFLGQVKCPYTPGRAADTQKCIRAGGKHNDLEDVGLDTYHHTFFEMLGNWSFGDYFKKEAIDWAWELVTEVWKFPKERLYATVYNPDPNKGDPSEFDQEAWDFWAAKFRAAGLDPQVHIVFGNKKDNFWMMGETGPCGPCSELHVDLTPNGDTKGSIVNKGDARCIEIWNLVFIQFNANPDGTFSPLPARHVDTGMGFERVTSIIQGTKGFSDFKHAKISNYETDIFRPIFDALEKMSGKKYTSTLPGSAAGGNATVPLKTVGEAPGGIVEVDKDDCASASVSTLPTQNVPALPGSAVTKEQEAIDIAFRVIADHIRTLSFAIADGIQPGNTDRNYVLRRILRRAVRYGRTLGFHEPFFYKLVDVLAQTMGDVFPEIRGRKGHVQETIRIEEEAFNKTLDRGIELFNDEVGRLGGEPCLGGTGNLPAGSADPALSGARYSQRNLPHFEKAWAIYVINFQTLNNRQLSPAARDIVLDCILHWRETRYRLIAACVMPGHVHMIIQPGIKEQDAQGQPVFWPLSEILHSIKSFSAKEVNKLDKASGVLWQDERFDRFIRSDADLQEKFRYVCGNPWAAGVVDEETPYRWLWTPDIEAAKPYVAPASLPYAQTAGQVARQNGPVARSTQARAASTTISGDFAFKLYDTYGFPLDLTELMARERGLTVDTAGFEKLMEEQRARARAAQKKEVISLSQIETTTPTKFVGFENLAVRAKVLEVVGVKDKTAVVLDTTSAYAEMGGQVGDTGELSGGGQLWRVVNTQKSGNTWLHFIASEISNQGSQIADVPAVGSEVELTVDRDRRNAIQRHHTVTHLLHWALHEVVSQEASQKGSFVGPDKLTFDFNAPPLTPQQVADIEKLVNERVLENAGVSWTEVPYAEVKARKDVMQFFGDKYGDTVRVVQIGGHAKQLDGYSMELCGGTHTRATGEIGLFRIVGENAIAAGVRRIEAVAGLQAYDIAQEQLRLLRSVAGKINSPIHELEKKVEALLAHQKELEKSLRAASQKEAAGQAKDLVARAKSINGTPSLIENLGTADGDTVQSIVDAVKSQFKGVIVLGAENNGAVTLIAAVTPEFTAKVQAGKIIQTIAPIVGGKGGGKPDNARGGGKDASKLDEALAKAQSLL
jgi:alanyl-tRNA synthetase/REP element-mobilizing transposase RayT